MQTLYNAALENNCSEQASRMAAMESSTKNATELVGKLTLSYNRWAPHSHLHNITASFWGVTCVQPCCVATAALSRVLTAMSKMYWAAHDQTCVANSTDSLTRVHSCYYGLYPEQLSDCIGLAIFVMLLQCTRYCVQDVMAHCVLLTNRC